jgi:hypothetical protein
MRYSAQSTQTTQSFQKKLLSVSETESAEKTPTGQTSPATQKLQLIALDLDLPDKEPPADCEEEQSFSIHVPVKKAQLKHFTGAPVRFLPRRQTGFKCDKFTPLIGSDKVASPAKPYLTAALLPSLAVLDLNHRLQFDELTRFFATKQDFLQNVVLPFGGPPCDGRPSLRLLNWTVTILAQLRSLTYFVDAQKRVFDTREECETGGVEPFVKIELGNSYLQAIAPPSSKVDFDPCRRHARILFPVAFRPEPIETTLGQLNFFRWVHRIALLQWVDPRKAELKKYMTEYKKLTGKRKRDGELRTVDGEDCVSVEIKETA